MSGEKIPRSCSMVIDLGRVVQKLISANPGLKVNREFNFFYIKVFLVFMFCED